ncbi:hypothetical protein [Gramella sp. KN1008]|uniref:hypothetical protein n=1 Tax=Gramella sp. KN1008 TaxID=2529298 RepID=UPI00103B478A|nr:hypothetical protein [Gramella sp. KN1008]TBW29137.1 hypothetical protein EZJ28_04420 [Gramella sp. KN1008]
MKKVASHIAWIFIILLTIGCSEKSQKTNNAEVRIFNATLEGIQVEVESSKNQHSEKMKIEEGGCSDYISLPGEIYDLKIHTQKKFLLNKKSGLAPNEKYTAVIYGKPEFSSKVNEASFSHKLHYVFAGAENHTKNGFLPTHSLFRDKIKLKKGVSSLRAFHAASGIAPIKIKIKTDKKSQKLTKGLAYGKPVLGKHFKAGSKKIEVYLKGSTEPILEKEYTFKSQKAYLIVFLEKQDGLGIEILEN